MALIERYLDITVNKVEIAVERVRLANLSKEPLYLCYSGGKDSKVVRRICEMAGVPFETHYNLTTVDHPSVVQEIKADKSIIIDKAHYSDGTPITMWNLIVRKRMPPTRIQRYCCAELKETNGAGRICVTGVRKAESVARSLNGGVVKILADKKTKESIINNELAEVIETPKGGLIMNLDNDENRRQVEQCYRTNKTLINPIIDWTDEDVWEFSKVENIPQSPLYKEMGGAYKRLGCIGCPMATVCEKEKEFADYPKIKQNYINAFQRLVDGYDKAAQSWVDGEAVFDWWVYGNDKIKTHADQISIESLLDK